MRLLLLKVCLASLVMILPACSQTSHAKKAAKLDGPSLDPSLIISSPEDEIERDDLTVRQVERKNQAEIKEPWDKALTVEQLNSQSGVGEYAFDAVKGDHPCDGGRLETDACQATSKAIAEAANAKKQSTQGGAEAELQTLTSQIIDPDTFDPLTTIDEIGRGDQFSSLAAQAVGAEFLTPTVPQLPVEDAETPSPDAGLVPFVLDITVTQGTPGTPP
jgi:hypothetical protein